MLTAIELNTIYDFLHHPETQIFTAVRMAKKEFKEGHLDLMMHRLKSQNDKFSMRFSDVDFTQASEIIRNYQRGSED